MREADVERRKLQELVTEIGALRDRADRACREAQALRKKHRLTIQQSRQLVRESTSAPLSGEKADSF